MLLLVSFPAFALRINLLFPPELLDTSITRITLHDVQQLLHQSCACEVGLNASGDAEVELILPNIPNGAKHPATRFAAERSYPYSVVPESDFAWKQEVRNQHYRLTLTAFTHQAISNGLYALLQERLGFAFYHPKNTRIPRLTEWPLPEAFEWSADALFDKRGFHLHTQHPLELTEALHDGTLPHALEDIQTYIDWLARNGQNYFEFCLLESIDRKVWIHHARNITNYVHQRGMLAAVDLSLHMIQQKTFQLYTSPAGKQKQIEKNLEWICSANWDFLNMEFSTAEFIGGNQRKKEGLRQFIIQWLLKHTHTKLMGRRHVVKQENEAANGKKQFVWDSTALALDRNRGVLSHTVMFYDMTEPQAPVYENENQRHMFDFLIRENQIRETWYYPESAYWITFDNSVPMLLLPYLSARLKDIDTCAAYRIPGHITFSSGWEWGYWLIDWSIARWSWKYQLNGTESKRYPEQMVASWMNAAQENTFAQALHLQQTFLKDSLLMQWMTAMTITDEIGIKAIAKEFHPRPPYAYRDIRNSISSEQLADIATRVIPALEKFSSASMRVLLNSTLPSDSSEVIRELSDGIAITALRAAHRAAVLRYLTEYRKSKLLHQPFAGAHHLKQAAEIRTSALEIVKRREQGYRYDLNLIAGKRPDHTAYHFGYLYPVSHLHFWYREEQQAEKNKYKPWFNNIWNVARIIGLIK